MPWDDDIDILILYTFPFIDFWLVYDRGDEVHMTDGYTFDKKEYLDLKEIEFEGCKLFVTLPDFEPVC